MSPRARRRLTKAMVLGIVVAGLVVINGPTVTNAAKDALHDYKVNSSSYKERNGHWSVLDVPDGFRVNAIHAAMLRTGKLLIIAGSGNNREDFDAGTFKTLIWDPKTDKFKLVHTPSDVFCAGHIFLPDGKLLIAGGTRRYEKLRADITHAAGVMTVKNEDPDGGAVRLAKGTRFQSKSGKLYRATRAVTVKPAAKKVFAGGASTKASSTQVWVEAVEKGRASEVKEGSNFSVEGLPASQRRNVYGVSVSITLAKQEYWGDDKSYLFDPATERYEAVSNLKLARWYPTLVGLKSGRVLAISGLDEFGRIIPGHNELYDPRTKRWEEAPQLKRTFPTYPSMFLMPSGNLFYTGSNAGYGSDTVGRAPGIWNLEDNTFRKVPGLRDATQTETSGSVLLPPAQDQRYMIAGGGGVGESKRSTARTDVIDLKQPNPRFTPGPDLDKPTRYPNMVITPDDRVVITGGSTGYRGEGRSDVLICNLYDPTSGTLTRVADPTVGRNYHAQAILLPDGRVVTLGSDPLYSDSDNTKPGKFEQRIEVFSPPYLYQGRRPALTGGPEDLKYGTTATFSSSHPGAIKRARLIRPSAVTHVTDVEQRSVALPLTRRTGGIDVKVPTNTGLLPPGWYMLFVSDAHDRPSEARWVHVS